MNQLRKAMQEKENCLRKERDELRDLVNQLTELTKRQKKRVDELMAINMKQEETLRRQKEELEEKVGFKWFLQQKVKPYS